jgi:hypothetical protein
MYEYRDEHTFQSLPNCETKKATLRVPLLFGVAFSTFIWKDVLSRAVQLKIGTLLDLTC